jgi:hypothetical protein
VPVTGPEGCFLRVIYRSDHQPGQVQVELLFSLQFLRDGYPETPVMIERGSLQDAVQVSSGFGPSPGIDLFEWTADNSCTVSCSGFEHGGVYRLLVAGGPEGVLDQDRNYLVDDLKFYFKVFLEKE